MYDENKIKNILLKLSKTKPCFCSEADLRDSFARELLTENPNLILLPEFSPSFVPDNYVFGKKINFDLVCIDKETQEQVIFEFKYKTKKYKYDNNYFSFELHNQNDTTFGRYCFWKDIYRLETFVLSENTSFNQGFLIFLTNNDSYIKPTKQGSDAFEFSLSNGLHKKGFKRLTKSKKEAFEILNDYYFDYYQYSNLNVDDCTFSFCCIGVNKKRKEINYGL